jgi:hypothetical protein
VLVVVQLAVALEREELGQVQVERHAHLGGDKRRRESDPHA